MRRQKGGVKWRQGTDGCIFNPSVACEGDSDDLTYGTISKIMPKQGSMDERIEKFIKTRFPDLVAKKGVVVAKVYCTPKFTDTNLEYNEKLNQSKPNNPCMQIQKTSNPNDYVNFIMEKYDNNFYGAYYNATFDSIFIKLRHALNAAVALVPDKGPWVLGFDFHLGNIFVKKKGNLKISSLADWGRTIIIENPNDPDSIQKGIQDALKFLRNTGWKTKIPTEEKNKKGNPKYLTFPLLNFASYPQVIWFNEDIRKAIDDVNETPVVDNGINKNIHYVRLTSIIGILRDLTNFPAFQGVSNKQMLFNITLNLLKARSQKDIADILNKHIVYKEFPNGYIDLTLFLPPVAASSISAIGAGAGASQAISAIGAGAGASQATVRAATTATSAIGAGASQATVAPRPATTVESGGYTIRYMGGKRTRKQNQRNKKSKQTRCIKL